MPRTTGAAPLREGVPDLYPSMKKFSAAFYLILLGLTVLVLGCLGLWLWLDNEIFLYVMIALFAVYLFHLIYSMVHADRREKREQTTEELLRAGLKGGDCVVYLTYFGGERHIRKPSLHKAEYLVELYPPSVDGERLKKHLWFGLSDQEENLLSGAKRYEAKIAYPALALIEGKTVYLPAGFYEAAKKQAAFSQFLNKNTIVLYGEN